MPTDGEDKNTFRFPTPDDMMDLYEREIRKTILQQMLAPPILARDLRDPEPPVHRSRAMYDPYLYGSGSIRTTPGTPVAPSGASLTFSYLDLVLDHSPYIPSPILPHWTDPPDQDPYPDLRPRVPVQYTQSARARTRSAVFTGQEGACLRCGRRLEGQQVVNVAPTGLPRATVHIGCLETDDQIEGKTDGSA